MAPRDKVSAEQKTFLFSLMDTYLEAQKKGRLDKFWLEMQGVWFHSWEEVEDPTIKDAKERAQAHADAIAARIKYLRRWFPNHSGKKVRANPYGRLVNQAMKKVRPKRRPQLVQLYTKLFYAERVAPLVQAEMKRLTLLNGVKPSRGVFLRLLRAYSAAKWKLEDEEVKGKVIAEYDRLQKEKDSAAELGSPSAMAAAIKDIPIHFAGFSQLLASLSGWSFTLLAGGPDPLNAGRIQTFSVHSGENHTGMHFGKAMPNFLQQIVAPYAVFLRSVYTPSECAARSLFSIEGNNSEENRLAPPDLSHHVDVPVKDVVVPPVAEAPSIAPVAAATPIVPVTSTDPFTTLLPNATASIPPSAGDFDYEFSFDELNLLQPGDLSFDQLEGALGDTPPGGYLSLVEELAAPLPEHVLRQLNEVTGPVNDPASAAPTMPVEPIANTPVVACATVAGSTNSSTPVTNAASAPSAPTHPTATNVQSTINLAGALPPLTTDGAATTATMVSPFIANSGLHLPPANADASANANANANNANTNTDLSLHPPSANADANADANANTDVNYANANANADPASASHPPPADAETATTDARKALGDVAAENRPRKRTRDPIDEALIVGGKRARKTKTRTEVELVTKGRGKENRAPK